MFQKVLGTNKDLSHMSTTAVCSLASDSGPASRCAMVQEAQGRPGKPRESKDQGSPAELRGYEGSEPYKAHAFQRASFFVKKPLETF